MHFWQVNYLMLIFIFPFPLFKEMFPILPRKPTWYNGCRDLIQTIPSRKYLQVKDPFITLPLPLNACHIECGLCLLLSSSLYAENSLDFAKFKSWAESFFTPGTRCSVSFFSGACVALVVEVLKCWMCEVGSPQYVAVLWREAGISLLVAWWWWKKALTGSWCSVW